MLLTEVVWRSQRRENTGEELQTHLDLSAVAVPVQSQVNESVFSHVNTQSQLFNSQCKLMSVFPNFMDVVLQVVEEQLHHVQFLLSPPDRAHEQIAIRT